MMNKIMTGIRIVMGIAWTVSVITSLITLFVDVEQYYSQALPMTIFIGICLLVVRGNKEKP